MDWRGAVTRRWQYKVAALFVAVLLWLTVTTDEQQEQPVPTRVEWQVRDSSYVLVEAPGQVQTVFQARTGELLSFVAENPVIRYTVDTVTSETMRVSLATGMVDYGQVGSARPLAVRPAEMLLRFEPRVRRRVPVRSSVEVSPAEGYAVVDSPTVQPGSVTMTGARSEVEGISSLSTDPVSFEEVDARLSRDVPVHVPDDAPNVEATPGIVLVTVDVDSLVARSLRRPVRLRDGPAGGLVLVPDSATVRLRGPSSVVDGLPPDSVQAWVELAGDAPPEPGESTTLPVSASVPGFPGIEASVEPPEVEVRRDGAP